jgi:hypothetical protein
MHLLKIANEKRLKRPSKQPFAHFSRNTATGLLRPSSGKKYRAAPDEASLITVSLRQHFCGKRKRAAPDEASLITVSLRQYFCGRRKRAAPDEASLITVSLRQHFCGKRKRAASLT